MACYDKSTGAWASQPSQAPAGILIMAGYVFHIRLCQPACHSCHQPAVRRLTRAGNSNGNAGRPYYVCPTCTWENRWVCWADDRGILEDNPRCECGMPCRQDRVGHGKEGKAGRGFWTCIAGTCGFYSENMDGTPGTSVDGFVPWLCS